jgi:hypothetical protein
MPPDDAPDDASARGPDLLRRADLVWASGRVGGAVNVDSGCGRQRSSQSIRDEGDLQ